jgi:hypothetical protein
MFVLHQPFDRMPATVGNGTYPSLLAENLRAVTVAWQRALAAPGRDERGPGLLPRYARDFFAAYCRDSEGHKLRFVPRGRRRRACLLPLDGLFNRKELR